jgi:serpin B
MHGTSECFYTSIVWNEETEAVRVRVLSRRKISIRYGSFPLCGVDVMKQSIYMRIWIFFILSTLILTGCSQLSAEAKVVESDLPRDTSPSVSDEDLMELAEGNQAFALDLYQALLEEEDGNLFYSPYSISAALAMTYAGARNVTEKEMGEVLHFTLPQDHLHPAFNALDLLLTSRGGDGGKEDDGFQLNIANALWGQKGYEFLSEFLDMLAKNYGAGLRVLDFGQDPEKARLVINDWVYEKTEEKIEDLIPKGVILQDTRLVLTNAIYFNADWRYAFPKSDTYDGDFHLNDGTVVSVPLMSQTESFRYGEGEDYQAIALPYVGGEMEMVIILPSEGRFEDFERSLNAEKMNEILNSVQTTEVALTLPKFEFESDFSLSEILIGMGMPSAFGAGVGTDFSGMDGTLNLVIKEVLHKAFVSVDEEGTEAAAATAVIMVEMAAVADATEMRIDRPFIFMIRDTGTNSPLFLGRVMNPVE